MSPNEGHGGGHADHEHFNCGCGKVFHSRQELTDHTRRLNHKAA